MIDFSREFLVVNHPVLLAKLSKLDLPECIIQNWIVSFLVGHSQCVKTDCSVSSQLPINGGIVQGFHVEPIAI